MELVNLLWLSGLPIAAFVFFVGVEILCKLFFQKLDDHYSPWRVGTYSACGLTLGLICLFVGALSIWLTAIGLQG